MASQWPPKKNAEFTLDFTLYKNDGTVIANPGTITKKISKDEGAVADITAAITEEDTTYGQCSVVLSATEMNADRVWVYITDDTAGCIPFTCSIYTTANYLDDIKTDTAATLADLTNGGRLDILIDAIKERTDNLPDNPSEDGAAMTLTSDYDAAKTAATQTSVNTLAGYVDTEIAAMKGVLDKIDTAVELDGSVYRFTENALEMGPLNSEGATTATIAAAVWSSLRTALTTTGSIGKSLADWFANAPPSLPPATASDVVICNNALSLLGNTTITTLTGESKASKLCAQFYHQVVNATLRAYTWNCATVRSSALTATTAPSFGFSYAFTLPADCLRVLTIEDDETIKFKVEGSTILTDEATCKITYIKRIDIEEADSLLIEAISARLAATIAFALTNSTSTADAMWKLYKDKLDEAQTIDAFEGSAPQVVGSDWVNSRG